MLVHITVVIPKGSVGKGKFYKTIMVPHRPDCGDTCGNYVGYSVGGRLGTCGFCRHVCLWFMQPPHRFFRGSECFVQLPKYTTSFHVFWTLKSDVFINRHTSVSVKFWHQSSKDILKKNTSKQMNENISGYMETDRMSFSGSVNFKEIFYKIKLMLTHQNSPSSSTVIPRLFLSMSPILFHSSELRLAGNIISDQTGNWGERFHFSFHLLFLPVTPGSIPLMFTPWVPHADKRDRVIPKEGQQAMPQPHPLHCCHRVRVTFDQTVGQTQLPVLRRCLTGNMRRKHTGSTRTLASEPTNITTSVTNLQNWLSNS